jgi:hypothetical protein
MSAPNPGQYGEPVQLVGDCVIAATDGGPVVCGGHDWDESGIIFPDVGDRIVACVNALDGLDPAALPTLIEAAKETLGLCGDVSNCEPTSWTRSVQALRAALAALGVRQ